MNQICNLFLKSVSHLSNFFQEIHQIFLEIMAMKNSLAENGEVLAITLIIIVLSAARTFQYNKLVAEKFFSKSMTT